MAVIAQGLPLQHARDRRVQYPKYFRLGYAGLLLGALATVCMLSILYLAQTGRVATRGYTLQDMQNEHVALMRDAEQYEYRIAAANRLDVIEQRATQLGMRPAVPSQLRYLTIEMPAGPVVAQP